MKNNLIVFTAFLLSFFITDLNGQNSEKPSSEKEVFAGENRTVQGPVIAFGFNNTVSEGAGLNDDMYKSAGSRFAEVGWAWRTNLSKNGGWFRVSYGLSFQFNGLKPEENRIFVRQGSETVLEAFPEDLRKSKFRMDNIVVPLHIEIGPSKKIKEEGYTRFSSRDQLKLGIGGYAGVNINTMQKLKYTEEGIRIKEKLTHNYNTNDVIYGLSAYISMYHIGLYAKYDLNPIFKDNPVEERNISFGLRAFLY